jgi:hypothetical protein
MINNLIINQNNYYNKKIQPKLWQSIIVNKNQSSIKKVDKKSILSTIIIDNWPKKLNTAIIIKIFIDNCEKTSVWIKNK